MKPCPQCGRIVHAFIVKCPDCGHLWLSDRPLNLEDMVPIYSRDQAHQIKDPAILRELFHSHRRRIYRQGYAPTLAEHNFYEHCGRQPKLEWYFGSLGLRSTPDQHQIYLNYLNKSARRLGQRPEWVMSEFEKEFGPGTWQRMLA